MKKRRLVLFFLLYVIFMAVASSPIKAAKGGFYNLSGGANPDGGSAIIDWRDLEPEEGQYHWELLTVPNTTFVSWKQYYDRYMCELAGRSDCVGMTSPVRTPGTYLHGVPEGKGMRLKLRTTDGAIPLWLFGGRGHKEGQVTTSYGGTCAYETYDEVYAKDPRCDPQNDIIWTMYYPLHPTREDGSQPVWWSPVFQEKMKRVLMALAEKIESDPELSRSVEFIEASVGSYGELTLGSGSDPGEQYETLKRQLLSVGYTNAVYSNAVQKILGNYAQAFTRTPIALSVGNALYGAGYDDGSGVNDVLTDVLSHTLDVWGSRIYLKFAGFGGNGSWWPEQLFPRYCPAKTRCIWESYGGICSWAWNGKNFPFYDVNQQNVSVGIQALTDIFTRGANAKAYIIMMWGLDWAVIADARRCGGSLADLTDTQVADIGRLREAFDRTVGLLYALGAIEPSPPPVLSPTPPFNPPISLETGWNTITLPHPAYPITTFSLPFACGKLTKRESGKFISFVSNFLQPFNLTGGDKYHVLCSQTADW